MGCCLQHSLIYFASIFWQGLGGSMSSFFQNMDGYIVGDESHREPQEEWSKRFTKDRRNDASNFQELQSLISQMTHDSNTLSSSSSAFRPPPIKLMLNFWK